MNLFEHSIQQRIEESKTELEEHLNPVLKSLDVRILQLKTDTNID